MVAAILQSIQILWYNASQEMQSAQLTHLSGFIGEAHIGLTRFFKHNKDVAVQNKIVAPPVKTIEDVTFPTSEADFLDERRPFTTSTIMSSRIEHDSESAAAIGDGQSYVHPELLHRHHSSTKYNPSQEIKSNSLSQGLLFICYTSLTSNITKLNISRFRFL